MQNPKLVLIVIAVMFFGPLLLALLMRSEWWDFRPSSLSNRGTLVQPPAALPLESIKALPNSPEGASAGAWVVLYSLPADCPEACQKTVTGLRQLHLATGRHRDRVEIWLLARRQPAAQTLDVLGSIYPEFHLLLDASGEAGRVLTGLGEAAGDSLAGQAFLLDPRANIILRYAPDFHPHEISQDLDRLLTWAATE
jgi:peroxiredoxin